MLFITEGNVIGILHYYSIALAFVFGAFVTEWISGRLLIKEPRGTKGIWDRSCYINKTTAIFIRVVEVLLIALISIPLSSFLVWIFDLSSFYVVVISIILLNTVYLGILLELPYKIELSEGIIVTLIYLIGIIATLMTLFATGKIG